MRVFKLLIHQKNFSEDEVILNQRDYPNCNIGDVIELHSPENDFSRLLLRIKSFPEEKDALPKDKPSISLEQSVANTFQLRPYGDVVVNKVEKKDVILDSLEIIFKDQYLSRCDMWRTRKNLLDNVVYLNKKFDCPSLRFQVFEMWKNGERMACGYIDENTKIVFRSASSMVYLFIQMSSEMWDFDIHGDLYFEKAINGFICDLFEKWRRFSCNHDVTIVLFSRTYYDATSIEEFPEEMRDCLQTDYRHRFYEDFYRIAVQNERYDEWNSTVILLKKLFSNYHSEVLQYHEKWGKAVPRAYNSSASQGNILEVLNMSLNVFEKHYLDRSFDRTGQLSVIISPGVGVFDVDFDLTNITKQRIIDNGIGSDLVCLGEQPIHAVPIFRYNRRGDSEEDVYNMPHWINLSFYSSRKKTKFSSFIPRIKMPEIVSRNTQNTILIGYDQHAKPSVFSNLDMLGEGDQVDSFNDEPNQDGLSHSFGAKKQYSFNSKSKEDNFNISAISYKKEKAKVNPFDSSDVMIKLTSNRRRWTHIFPLGENGMFMQEHHYQVLPQNTACALVPISCGRMSLKKTSTSHTELDSLVENSRTPDLSVYAKETEERKSGCRSKVNFLRMQSDKNFTLSSVTTGVDWKSLIIPACLPLTTDFLPDSRSLENEYLDSEYCLIPEDQGAELSEQRCYRDEDYHNHQPLTTQQVFQEFICQRLQQGFQIIAYIKPHGSDTATSTKQNTPEHKGLRSNYSSTSLSSLGKSSSSPSPMTRNSDISTDQSTNMENSYTLSIGRIFHKIEMDNFTIKVKISRPRHPYQIFKIHYCYRFCIPDNNSYGVSWVDFTNEKLENYNWNYLDNYVCMRGDEHEYELRESHKFWRLRLLLLPSMQSNTRQILDSILCNKNDFRCDIYNQISLKEKLKLQEGFLKFFEIINRIRRPMLLTKKSLLNKDNLSRPADNLGRRYSSGFSLLNSRSSNISTSVSSDAAFRERLGSNVIYDRPKAPKMVLKTEKMKDDCSGSLLHSPSLVEGEVCKFDLPSNEPVKKISSQNLSQIMDAIKSGMNGFNFLPKQGNWPTQTFVSADAVNWALEHVENITNEQQAINLFQKLLDSKQICHASGDFAYPFKYGFYLYFIVIKGAKYADERVDLKIYKREWYEVELSALRQSNEQTLGAKSSPVSEPAPIKHSILMLKNPLSSLRSSSNNPSRLLEPNVNKQTCKGTAYYKSMLDINFGSKTGRNEWVHIRYQQIYDSTKAFEIVLEWMVATSNQIADIVQGWARKAGLTGLHLVPIPSDPFALPFSGKSDPLRSPIYVSLNFDCLPIDFTEQLLACEKKLLEFREEILTRFGFLPFLGGLKENQKQYVHVSGSIFVLIPNLNPKVKLKKEFSKMQQMDEEHSTPHEIYINRHFSGSKQNKKGLESIKTGFLWSWNYMISKRWKTPSTGDENFQRKVLKDFRLFCSNDQNRLYSFWETFSKNKEGDM